MNKHVATSTGTALWELPDLTTPFTRADGPGRGPHEHARWARNIERIRAIALRNDWTKNEMAQRVGMASGTFSQVYSAKYQGRFDTMNDQLERFIALQDEIEEQARQIPQSPPFMQLVSAREIIDTLQAAQVMPALVMITAAAGCGKTAAAEFFAETRPHVYMATISPHTKTVHGALTEIANTVGLHRHNPGTLVRSIGEVIKRKGNGSLLIVDEAQHLLDDAVNQLRHFVDRYACGVAIMGNTETYSRFSATVMDGTGYGQLRRRFFRRILIENPRKDDLRAFIKACGIEGEKEVAFLTGIGMKPGAFGQVDMTVKLAKMVVAGDPDTDGKVTIDALRWAWENRDVEALA